MGMSAKPPPFWQQRVLAVLLALGVVAFNIWTVQSVTPSEVRLLGGAQGDYSNLVMHSLLEGHLYVDITPAPGLVHAENPYDPAKRPPGVTLSDASYYKGHFYMYFGVAPVVTLFMPWWAVTGHDLPAPYAALILVNGAFLTSAFLWWRLRRRYFPDSGALVLAIGILVIGLGSMTHTVLRRTSIWEPPVAAGYFFATLALLALYHGLHRARRMPAFALSSMFLGLAVGSRPTYVVATAALAVPLILDWIRARRDGRKRLWPDRSWWAQAIALGAPFALLLSALLVYNYARFEDPLEFGMRYQLTGTYEAAVRHFSATYLRFNAYVYYLSPAQWSRYVPFVEPIHIPPTPPGYFTCEYVYGILSNLPFAWIALLSPLALFRRPPGERRPLAAFLGSFSVFASAMGVFLCFFVTSTARYMVDFAPELMLLACVGLLSGERLARPAWTRRLLLSFCGLIGAASLFVCTMLNFQLLDLLRRLNPPLYSTLAHACDRPAWLFEQRQGTGFGPLELDLRFPEGKVGRIEPLVTTGWEFASDYLFVQYMSASSLRIGFAQDGRVRWSDVMPLDYRRDHHLSVSMGSLLPPREHPFFDGWSDLQYSTVGRWLLVTLDGNVLLDAPQDFYDGSSGSLRIGSEPTNTYGGRFTGRINRVSRGQIQKIALPSQPSGPIEIELAIPASAVGREVPLVTTGARGRGDALIMQVTRPGWVRFYYDNWGDPFLESAETPISSRDVHHLVVDLPSFRPSAANEISPRIGRLFVALDGRVLALQDVPGFPARKWPVSFGSNGIESSWSEPEYPWAISKVRALRPADLPPALPEPPSAWLASSKGGATQSEAVDLPFSPQSVGERASGASRMLCLSGSIWALALIWVLGRIAGLRWSALFARCSAAFILPLLAPTRWIWNHRLGTSLFMVAAVAGAVGWEKHLISLHSVGPMRIRLLLPTDQWGRQQPILSTGRQGAGTVVFVNYVDRSHIRVGADIWGAAYTSAPLDVDYLEPQEFIINSSALYPKDHPGSAAIGAAQAERMRGEFFVAVGGRTVLTEARPAYESKPSEVVVGKNAIGSSLAQPLFAGRILSAGRIPAAREYDVAREQVVRVRFRLDPSSSAVEQPLVSLGEKGSLGLCTLRRESDSSARVIFRSPAGTLEASGVYPVDPDSFHEFEVAPGYEGAGAPRASARMALDGVRVSARTGFTPYSHCPVTVGLDPSAPPGIAQFFTGRELDSVLIPSGDRAPITGPSESLLFILKFPTDQTGADPLITSGVTGAGDFIYVEYLAGGRVRFGCDHWGYGGHSGQPLPVDTRLLHRLEIQTAGLFPSQGSKASTMPIHVKLDGVSVLDAETALYPRSAYQIHIGENPIGGSTAGARFRGEILVSEPPDSAVSPP